MSLRQRTAVIAAITDASARQRSRLLAAEGYSVARCLSDGRGIGPAVRALLPDLLVLDDTLPGLDGLSAAEDLCAQGLPVRPGIIVVRRFAAETERVRALRAEGCAFANAPLDAAALRQCLAEVAPEARRTPARITERLTALLDRLGLPERPGRRFLERAILLAWQDARLAQRLTRELYPLAGGPWDADAKKVERDMRRAIDYAWKYGKIEEQYAIFGGTIDAQRGKPTCGEMIARLADILRLEG